MTINLGATNKRLVLAGEGKPPSGAGRRTGIKEGKEGRTRMEKDTVYFTQGGGEAL